MSLIVIGLKHTKSNNGMRLPHQAFEIDFSDGAVTFAKADITDIPELSESLSLTQQISAALRKGDKTVKELAEGLEISEGTIRTTLNRGKDRGIFVRTENLAGEGKWGLLVHDPA